MRRRPASLGSAGGLRVLAVVACAVSATACADTPRSSGTAAATLTGPTPVNAVTDPSANPPRDSAAGAVPVRGTASVALMVVDSEVVAFPPRDQSFAFRQELEQIYRTELGRPATSTYVDVEGDLVWLQEYLRYRVNACGHVEAVQKVFDQIDRGTITPVCGTVSGSVVGFPPREDSFDFRSQLDAKYRDGLRRTPSPSFVDAEGAIVWTQEYLRYRVNACDDATARAAVRTEIRGGPPPPVCNIPAPRREVVGHWTGMIAMPGPRPFRMDIRRVGSGYSGTYFDYVRGSVTLTWDGADRVQFHVYFGDGAAWFDGRFVAPDRVKGLMRYVYITTPYDFDMTRD